MRRIGRRILWVGPAMVAVFGALFAASWMIFPFDRKPLYDIPTSIRWWDRDGIPLRIRLSKGDYDSVPTYIYNGDDWIAKAVVAAEDQRFWTHGGWISARWRVRASKQ